MRLMRSGTLLVLCALLALAPAATAAAGESVVAVVIAIDVSSSMSDRWAGGIKIESARQAAHSLLNLLEEEDRLEDRCYRVALVTFDTDARLVQPLTSDFDLLRRSVDDLKADGYTNIGAGLEVALAEFRAATHDRALILLLSDGVTNRGRSRHEVVRWLQAGMCPPELAAQEGLQASLYGADYEDGVDTRDNARVAGQLLRQAGYDDTVCLNRSKDVAIERLPRDAVFFFGGHANAAVLGFLDDRGEESCLRGPEVRRASPGNLLLAVLAGCKTAANVADRDNILRSFVDAGARVGVGFQTTVRTDRATRWRYAFWEAVTEGRTVQEAAWAGTAHCYFWCPVSSLLDPNVVVTYPSRVAHEMGLFDLEKLRRHQSQFPRVYPVGFGNPGDLDEELLLTIARTTGGEYLYGSRASELENVFLEVQHRGTGSVRAEFAGTIRAGEVVDAGRFTVDSGERELRVTLNWPGSAVELRLRDPQGRQVSQGYPGLRVWRPGRPTHVVLDRPRSGEWSVELFGQVVPEDGTSYFVVASTGDLPRRGSHPLEFFLVLAGLVFLAALLGPRLTRLPAGRKEVS